MTQHHVTVAVTLCFAAIFPLLPNGSRRAKKVQPTPELQRQQQSRSFGSSRISEFGGGGVSRGFPRSMPSGGGSGGGRRR